MMNIRTDAMIAIILLSAMVFLYCSLKKVAVVDRPTAAPVAPATPAAPATKDDSLQLQFKLPSCNASLGDSVDEYKYPIKSVDASKLMKSIKTQDFSAVESVFAYIQSAVEKDFRNEYLVLDAYQVFTPYCKGLPAFLEKWRELYPQSANPWAGLAKYYHITGWEIRGGNWTCNTPPDQLEIMKQLFDSSLICIDSALKINPKQFICYPILIDMTGTAGYQKRQFEAFKSAIEAYPYCFMTWATYIEGLEPRWGGSYDIMQRVIGWSVPFQECNPRLKTLQGLIYYDLGNTSHDYNEAAGYYTKALQYGKLAKFYYKRAVLNQEFNHWEEALVDIDSAVALRSQYYDYRMQRSDITHYLAYGQNLQRKVELLKRYCDDFSFASAFIPDKKSIRSDFVDDSVRRLLKKGKPLELGVLGDWYIWKEISSPGTAPRYYTIDDHQQVRAIRYSKSWDYFIENGKSVFLAIDYKWMDGYFVTRNEQTNKYDYRYKVKMTNNVLYMAEIDPLGNILTEDWYKPYPTTPPPPWWLKNKR
jgi:tetratricopeptide (TPR) repeat protein